MVLTSMLDSSARNQSIANKRLVSDCTNLIRLAYEGRYAYPVRWLRSQLFEDLLGLGLGGECCHDCGYLQSGRLRFGGAEEQGGCSPFRDVVVEFVQGAGQIALGFGLPLFTKTA